MTIRSLTVAGLAAAIFGANASAATLHQYTVRVDSALERLNVAACFDGVVPSRLIAHDTASLFLTTMKLSGPGEGALVVDGWEAEITGAPDNACVDYELELPPEKSGIQKGGPQTRRIGRDVLTAIGDWLWRPDSMAAGADIEVRFELPDGISVSAPWQRVDDSDRVFRVGTTPEKWPGVVAFGGFSPVEIHVPGARVELVLIDAPGPAFGGMLQRWIESAAIAVTTIYGVFPVPQLQVIVAPTPRGNKPVPWAYVARGGGSAVHLFVRPDHSKSDFMRDWTAVHEMSHLFLPYLEWGNAWLAEGLPTYFQNVAMARGGLITRDEAWRRMYSGFESAEKVARRYTVYEAAGRLGRRGIYRRVYWGGAAFVFASDLRLRETNSGGPVLTDVLKDVRSCCLNGHYRWNSDELIAKLDALSGTVIFSEMVEEQLKSRPFPDYDAAYQALGIQMLGGHPIYVDGPLATYRGDIMTPSIEFREAIFPVDESE